MTHKLGMATVALATLVLITVATAAAQGQSGRGPWWATEENPGPGRGWRGGRGPGGGPGAGRGPQFRGGQQDEQFVVDRDTFHFLLANHDKVHRTVKLLDNGIRTVTESDDPEVARKIQEHVHAMHQRVMEIRPIHMRDPLFRALFGDAASIKMELKETDKGMQVVETSDNSYVASLIQAHAKVVSLFVKNGFAEARQNHEVPPRD